MVAEARAAGTVSNCLENAQGTVSWKALLKTRMELMTTSATLCCQLQLPQIPILIMKMKSVNSENTYKKKCKKVFCHDKASKSRNACVATKLQDQHRACLGLAFPWWTRIQLDTTGITEYHVTVAMHKIGIAVKMQNGINNRLTLAVSHWLVTRLAFGPRVLWSEYIRVTFLPAKMHS